MKPTSNDRSSNRTLSAAPERCDGQGLLAAVSGAAAWLERQAAAVNALNVFPVPDGDTGTNMSLTMRATVGALTGSPEHHVGKAAASLARGALMGARGNSGVILSQIVRGFAKAIESERTLDGKALAEALAGATHTAYQGVGKPVEGTILTVVRRASEAADAAALAGGTLESVLAAATDTARIAVAETPTQLAVLRDAGVVDAGGQGLYLLFEGALRTLRGEQIATAPIETSTAPSTFTGDQTYGYCTEFLIQGMGLEVDSIRHELEVHGDSLLVVGDDVLVRVHVHTFDPGAAISVGSRLGILRQVKVDNMQLQHEVWKEEREAPIAGISVVAVASGDGFTELFRSLGIDEVVAGGQTMNPSAQDLVAAIERASRADVVLLPNNDNILLTAKQAANLTSRTVGVVPTRTLAQGVAAALALKFEASLDENVAAMTDAADRVDTGEVTVAVRDASFDGFTIAGGQAIGLLNGRIAAVGDSIEECFWALLAKMRPESAEILTVYTGSEADPAESDQLVAQMTDRFPDAVIEQSRGGQPHYQYIIARE